MIECLDCRKKALIYLYERREAIRKCPDVESTLIPMMTVSAGAAAFHALGLLSEEEAHSWTLKANAVKDEVKARGRR